MQKTVLIVIIVAIVVAVLLGIWLVVSNTSNPIGIGQSQGRTFDIQGMKVTVQKEGTGAAAQNGDRVTVNYIGYLPDGTKFDSTYDHNAPFSFTLGQGTVIKGWDLGLVGMKVGEKRELVIPPALAYGASGFANIIPKNATLKFDVEMMAIVPPLSPTKVTTTPKPTATPKTK